MTVSDVQVVEWATGVLAEWNEAGVLAAADVHITDRLVTMCAEPVSETARLGAALAVRAVRLGSTCLALDRLGELAGDDTADLTIPSSDAVLDALLESPLVAGSEGVTLAISGEAPADATIEGTPFSLARLALGDPQQSIRPTTGQPLHLGQPDRATASRRGHRANRPQRAPGDPAVQRIRGSPRLDLAGAGDPRRETSARGTTTGRPAQPIAMYRSGLTQWGRRCRTVSSSVAPTPRSRWRSACRSWMPRTWRISRRPRTTRSRPSTNCGARSESSPSPMW